MLSSVFLLLDIGGGEFMMILFVALLLFGGDKLPELAKGLGRGIRDFKDASEGVKREINNQIDSYETKKKEEKETPLIAEHSEDNQDGTQPETQPEPHVANTMPISESYSASDQYEDYQYHDGYNPDEYHNSDSRTAQQQYDDTYKNQVDDTNVSTTTEPDNKETKV